MDKPTIHVILGTVRAKSLGARVANWAMNEAAKNSNANFVLQDLKALNLPFEDEASEPFSGVYTHPEIKRWSETIGQADGYILITPEYNHATSAVLKNALDLLFKEWNRKPVTFISYSTGAFAGIRAIEQLIPVAVALQMAPLRASVAIPQAQNVIQEDGTSTDERLAANFQKMADDLLWWTTALKAAREQTPTA